MDVYRKYLARGIGACTLMALIVYILCTVDLYAYWNAVPPTSNDVVEKSIPALSDYLWNGLDPLSNQLQLKAKEQIKFSGNCSIHWRDWRTRSMAEFKTASQALKAAIKMRDLPSPIILVQIVRKSWFSPGEVVAAHQFAKITKSNDEAATWNVELKAPQSPGT